MKRSERPLVMSKWEPIATECFYKMIRLYGDKGFTADNLYALCFEASVPPVEIKRLSSKLMLNFKSSGLIRKTDRFLLSKRKGAGSKPLPVWTINKEILPEEEPRGF